VDPFTTAFSAVDCPTLSLVEFGLIVTDIVGTSAIVAVAALAGSTTLVAVNVMFCWLVSDIGTVYTPPDVTDPTTGVDHVTAVFEVPETAAVNAADCPFVIEIQVGLIEMKTCGISVTVAESIGRPLAEA
jgi:hypothetical protein